MDEIPFPVSLPRSVRNSEPSRQGQGRPPYWGKFESFDGLGPPDNNTEVVSWKTSENLNLVAIKLVHKTSWSVQDWHNTSPWNIFGLPGGVDGRSPSKCETGLHPCATCQPKPFGSFGGDAPQTDRQTDTDTQRENDRETANLAWEDKNLLTPCIKHCRGRRLVVRRPVHELETEVCEWRRWSSYCAVSWFIERLICDDTQTSHHHRLLSISWWDCTTFW